MGSKLFFDDGGSTPPYPPYFWCFKRTKNIIVYHFYIFRGGPPGPPIFGVDSLPKKGWTWSSKSAENPRYLDPNLDPNFDPKMIIQNMRLHEKTMFFRCKKCKNIHFFCIFPFCPHEKSVKKCIFLHIFFTFLKLENPKITKTAENPRFRDQKLTLQSFCKFEKKWKIFSKKLTFFAKFAYPPKSKNRGGYPPTLGVQNHQILMFLVPIIDCRNIKFWYFRHRENRMCIKK